MSSSGVEAVLPLLVKLVVSAWMISVSVMDFRAGRIPNWLTGPVILGVGGYQLAHVFMGEWSKLGLVVAWVLVFVLWMLHFVGGGDAKFLMALYALFPSMEFTTVLALILLVLIVPLLLLELVRRPVGESVGSAWRRLITGQVLPTEQELQERGRRYAWTFAIPGLVYAWLYWGIH
jgi:Flp pilus assembly protein protease CpaA